MTETAEFWAGAFGDEYGQRNRVDFNVRVPFWRRIIDTTQAATFLDVGCNGGFNLEALRSINPEFQMSGIDVNEKALSEAAGKGFDVLPGRADQLGELFGPGSAELVVTSGVLIHIAPEDLTRSMQAIVTASSRWVLTIEYAADSATEIDYRGHAGKLWKRPYGRLYETLGLSVVEFGIADGYQDCAFWLMEKQ